MKIKFSNDYATFRAKITRRFCGNAWLSILIVIVLYVLLWRQRGGNLIAYFLMHFFGVDRETANMIYFYYFRSYREVFFAAAITFVFAFLLLRLFRWMTKYFKEIDQGIDALQVDDSKAIRLSPEMLPFESKLNAVKQTLERQKAETALAEQRKNELVMYLAHDIRTPLTTVIGYLSLLEEAPDMPVEQRTKYTGVALEKAERLERLINELFEITRLHARTVALKKEKLDLYCLLVQLADEFYPIISAKGNSLRLEILKNAVSYSYPDTEILITADVQGDFVNVDIQNQGDQIPQERLGDIFEKFIRLDKARLSDTGGTGLGLSIAEEIIRLHGGEITVESEEKMVTFHVRLPLSD